MQTVRLAKRQREQSVWRKLNEISASIKLECLYSKKEILQFYSNHAPFGGNIMGLQAASWRYYARDAHLLSWQKRPLWRFCPMHLQPLIRVKEEKNCLTKEIDCSQNFGNKAILIPFNMN